MIYAPKPAFFRRAVRHCARSGAAMVEFAFCLPIFVVLMLGTVETCNVIYLRQSAKIAAYECARLGIQPQVTREIVEAQCSVILHGRRIKDFQFSCEPPDVSSLIYEDLFTTKVTIPASEGVFIGDWFYQGESISETVTIMAEY